MKENQIYKTMYNYLLGGFLGRLPVTPGFFVSVVVNNVTTLLSALSATKRVVTVLSCLAAE